MQPELTVSTVQLVPMVQPDQLDPPDHKVRPELQVLMVQPVAMARPEQQVPTVQLEQQVRLAQPDPPDHRA